MTRRWRRQRRGYIIEAIAGVRAAMSFDEPDTTVFRVVCPYCGEAVEVYLEPDVQGSLVMDCEVCCQPWQVHVTRDGEERYLDVRRGDGSE